MATRIMRHPSRFTAHERPALEEARAQVARRREPFCVVRIGRRYTVRSEHRALTWAAMNPEAEIVRTVTPGRED